MSRNDAGIPAKMQCPLDAPWSRAEKQRGMGGAMNSHLGVAVAQDGRISASGNPWARSARRILGVFPVWLVEAGTRLHEEPFRLPWTLVRLAPAFIRVTDGHEVRAEMMSGRRISGRFVR